MAKSTLVSMLILTTLLIVMTSATIEEDEKDCADQLQDLASCIPFVSGSATKPTPQCCEDTEKVRSKKPKCLCVLIKESADPSMALPVNTTLALQMPSACHSDAKVSDCPSILKLAPNSPDAKIFKDAAGDKATTTTTNPSSSSASGSSDSTHASGSGSGSKVTPNNDGGRLESLVSDGIIGLMVSVAWLFT